MPICLESIGPILPVLDKAFLRPSNRESIKWSIPRNSAFCLPLSSALGPIRVQKD